MTDVEGLNQAYRNINSVHHDGTTLFVAGSRHVTDWLHNPLIAAGRVRDTPRFRTASQVLSLYPGTTRIAGHSLGAAVATELAQQHGLQYEVYANPGISYHDDPHSHRHYMDVVSILDRGAQTTWSMHPHGYT